MADVEGTVRVLNKLNLSVLDEDWVKDVWEQDFAETNPIPIANLEEVQTDDCHTKNIRTLIRCLSPWATGREEKGFWATLVENDLPHRSLVALIYHLLEQGDKRLANAVQKEAGILAAELYFTLLRIPGSSAFKIFHPMLCQKAVDTFKCWKNLENPSPRKRKSEVKLSQQTKRGKGRKRARGDRSRDEDNPFEADEEEEQEEPEGLTATETKAIYQSLKSLLKTFVALLSTYSFKDNEQMTIHCVQILTELTKLDPETFHGKFDESTMENGVAVPHLAYIGLTHLCVSNNGAVPGVVSLVFKNLLPNLLMFIGENNAVAASSIPQFVQMIKDHAQAYVLYLIGTYGAPILPPVRVLLQHMCVKVPDKVEYRSRVAATIVLILGKLPALSYAKMMDWIYKFSRNAKISYRSFALSLVNSLLLEPERAVDETIAREYVDLLSHRFLLQMILSRCSDIAPTVRARAIQVFATCTTGEPLVKAAVKELVTPRPVGGRGPISRVVPTPDPTRTAPASTDLQPPKEGESGNHMDVTPQVGTPEGAANVTPVGQPAGTTPTATETPTDNNNPRTPGGIILTPGGEISMVDGKGVVSMLRRRAMDERVNVRKAALQALESLIRIEGNLLNAEDLKILNERCLDPALSVRKQAMQSLTDLLEEMPTNVHLQKAWLDGVLPLVMDRETSAQDKCFEILEHILLDNIVPHSRSNSASHKMTWDLLAILASNEGVDLRRFLQRACQHWGRGGRLKVTLMSYLQTHVGTQNNHAAWMFFSELAPFVQKLPHGFVVDYWNNTAKTAADSEYTTVHRVLSVLGHVAKNIPGEGAAPIANDLKDRLMQFDSPPELVAVTVTALGKTVEAYGKKLCQSQSAGDKAAAKAKTDEWFSELLTACDRYLSKTILEENQDVPVDEDMIVRHLFTLGEIAQLCPDKTPKRVFMLVQSLIASPVITSIDGSSQYPSSTQNNTDVTNRKSQETDVHCTTSGSNGQRTSLDSNAGPLCFTQGSQFTQTQLSQFRGSRMSSRVRAYAFITLGKLCLQNEDLAKKCVAAMARELEVATDPAIRNNLIIVLCDLCVRYTSVVDRFIDNIAACLKDESLIVRKQALTLITHLLQEDFLKWKGGLFFRFIITLVDESKEIQEFAEFCLIHLLMQRHPGMFHHHFIECIFHFNSYTGHSVYNKFSQTEKEKLKFSMKGRANAEKRRRIYVFLLEHLSDEHRFSLTAKLTKEVLGPVVDGLMPLDADSSGLIQDTLFVLACKEIKLTVMRSQSVDEDAVEAQDMAAAVMNAAKKTLITQVMKKNVIENIVPTIIGLKHMLERHHSPLLKDLMIYLRELVTDYKTEVKDIMAADRQLAKEIEFDLRKFEERQEEERQRQERELEQRSNPNTSLGSPLIPGAPSPRVQRGSPKDASPGRSGNSPQGGNKSPGSPKAVGSPRPAAPCMNLNKINTPVVNRRTSISTFAIMNSARKAMEKAQRLSSSSQPRSSKESIGSGCTTKRVGWADEKDTSKALTETIASTDDNDSVFATPKQQKNKPRLRAISTPSANLSVLGDITFHQGDLSMIPSTPDNTGKRVSDEDRAVPAMIHLMSPEQPRPKPRTWNIKSPADPLRARQLSDDVAPIALDLDDDSEEPRRSREILAPRRNSRKNKHSEQSDENTENENAPAPDEASARIGKTAEAPPRGRQRSQEQGKNTEKEQTKERRSSRSREVSASKKEADTSQTRRRSSRRSVNPGTPSQELDTSQSRRRSTRKR